MKTKIAIAVLIGFFLGALTVWQGKGHFRHKGDPQARHQMMMNKFSSKLDLTAEQREKVSVILDQKRKKIEALRETTKPQMEAIRQETKKEISLLLSPEQLKKYEILEEKMSARRKNK